MAESLFITELDGITAETIADALEIEWANQVYREEAEAEGAWLRAAEYHPEAAFEPCYF